MGMNFGDPWTEKSEVAVRIPGKIIKDILRERKVRSDLKIRDHLFVT